MRRLFDEEDRWTSEASDLARSVHLTLRTLIRDKLETGASIRDIEYIVIHEVGTICAHLAVQAAMARRTAKDKEKSDGADTAIGGPASPPTGV